MLQWRACARFHACLPSSLPTTCCATVEEIRSWASNADVRGCRILELGPGDNLCLGLILLGLGANSYDAVDINPLATGDHRVLCGHTVRGIR